MSNKSLAVLVGAAAVLCAAAYFTSAPASAPGRNLAGAKLVGEFDIPSVAGIDVGGEVKLSAGPDGWTVSTYQDYPADMKKLRKNLLDLAETKIGQVVRGRELEKRTDVVLRDGDGKEIVRATLGEMHPKWGRGRYAEKDGQTVLVGDRLDGFGSDQKAWVETKIVDDPYISFSSLADAGIDEAEFGFSTGVVAKVTIDGDTNRVATIGAAVKDSSNRYLRLDGKKWTFIVPSYSVEKLLPKPEPDAKTEENTEENAEEAFAPETASEPASEPAAEPEAAQEKE